MQKSKIAKKQLKKQEPLPIKKHSIIKNVSLQFDDFTELYEDVELIQCVSEQTKELSIKKLVKLLEKSYNLSFMNKEIKYFLYDGGLWLSCPKLKMNISQMDFEPFPVIKLSALTGKEYIEAIMDQSDSDSDSDNVSEEQFEGDLKCRRLKERKIKHVVQKVLKWRQLYAGINTKEKIPLQQGAKIVNISKKTLDDYLSQIKKGKKYGFNFNEHKNEKIGVLRQFIRKMDKTKK